MNDRFKFRVWDKRRNKFIESPEPTPLLQANGLLAYFKDAEYMNNYVIQFCTGLKDKNGTLIYEGDICEYEFEDIGKQKAIIYFNNKYASFLKKPLNDFQYAEINDCKVIGNIYENKELLEDTECQK